MKLLTLNIIVDNKENFMNDYEEILEESKQIEGLSLCIAEKKESKFQVYKEMLADTTSLYVTFYNEYNKLDASVLNCLVEDLKEQQEEVLVQRLSKYKGEKKTFYLTGGMNPNSLYFNRYIFKTEFLKDITIEKNEELFFEEKIILTSMKDKEQFPLLDEILRTSEILERNVNSYAKQFEKEWYIPFFEQFLLPYVQKNDLTIPEQKMIVYFIMLRFYLNLNSRDKQVIQGDEVKEFFALVAEVVKYIDDIYLIEIRNRGMVPKFFSYLLLKGKYGEVPFQLKKEEKNIFYYVNDNEYGKNCVEVRVAAINYEKDKLIIDGEIVGDYTILEVKDNFAVQLNGKNIEYIRTERFNIAKAFGESIYRYYPFQFEISKNEMEQDCEIQFNVRVDKKWEKLSISFDKTSSRLVRSGWSYYRFSDRMIKFSNETLQISKASKLHIAICEVAMCLKEFKTSKKKKGAMKRIGLKALYWMTKKHYQKKPVWIFFDKLYKGGDNAEYLFRYCMENHPEANCYYILNKTANEYEALKKKYGKHIVVFESKRNKLAVLNAQYIFATHASVLGFCGFNKTLRRFFKNLLNADVFCIQHGLTIQNIAQYQNRLVDNTKKYFCASKYEIDNLKRPVYGYHEEDLCLTGSPRYDGLTNRDIKQVLIAPTWRRNIVITGNKMGTAKTYNPDFKYTKYFEIYNNLINDERLLSVVKEYGYKLVFLIHPTLSSQVDDYDTNEYLSIIPAVSDVSYEKMLTESSVMLTDYSGIQFDFAYMKKPLLYYQPKELPPQYTEGVYQYETMGFGPIIEDYEDAVQKLCDTIKTGCVMEDKYVARVEDFFAYTDHSNCERIMKEVLK